jgi:abortive infection bacteriophage resistance protein
LLRYSKPPLNIPDQLEQLRDLGLLVRSDDLALNALELIGYYRLRAYWLFFEEPPALGETRSHRFKPGSSFEQVIELYNRDHLIRLLVIDAIERIEIAARSAWVQEMSMKHGPTVTSTRCCSDLTSITANSSSNYVVSFSRAMKLS